MNHRFSKSRRELLKSAAASGAVLTLGLDALGNIVRAQQPPRPDLIGPKIYGVWLEVGQDNRVTFYSPEVEYGQGTNTALVMLIAEEMDIDLAKVQVLQSGTDRIFANPLTHEVTTNSSAAVRFRFEQMRKIGAMAREMLKQAAALKWQVPLSELSSAQSYVLHDHSKRRASYGSLASVAAQLTPPADVQLRPADQWKLIGTSMPRLDIVPKCTGRAQYSVDFRMPGLLHAAVTRCPVWGSKVESFAADAAKARKGVVDVLSLGYGVAVVATDSWSARRALQDVKVSWSANEWDRLSSDALSKMYDDALDNQVGIVAKSVGDVQAAAQMPGSRVLDMEYVAPFLHHMCMEPPSSTAWIHDGVCELWSPTCGASNLVAGMHFLLDMPPENIIVHRSEFIGGSFGRRDRVDQDIEAVQLSQRLRAPVQVVQRREHDTRTGFYRPYQKSRIRAVIDASGNLIGWQQRIASQAISHNGHDLSELAMAGVDMEKLEPYLKAGGSPFYTVKFDFFAAALTMFNAAYTVPNLRVETIEMLNPLRPTYWRSVGQSINTFQLECALDEIAVLTNTDPFVLRKKMLAQAPRGQSVLDELATLIGWSGTQQPGSGSGWGIAFSNGFGAFAAMAVQVEASGKKLSPRRVVAVVDQGVTINLDQSEAQMQGGIIDGLAAACLQQITLQDGMVEQSSWTDYPTYRLKDTPAIEVKIVNSTAAPGSISELATPMVMPALVNAVYAATGQRVRELPLAKMGFEL
jgi:CO/xanthine dehydrogenase Mo-binding subunit